MFIIYPCSSKNKSLMKEMIYHDKFFCNGYYVIHGKRYDLYSFQQKFYYKLFIIYPCSSKNKSLMKKMISYDKFFIKYLFLVWEKILISFIFVQEEIELKLVHHAFCVWEQNAETMILRWRGNIVIISFFAMDNKISIAIFVSINYVQ